jgi:hypothetical protein
MQLKSRMLRRRATEPSGEAGRAWVMSWPCAAARWECGATNTDQPLRHWQPVQPVYVDGMKANRLTWFLLFVAHQ